MTSKRNYYDILQVSMFAEQEIIDAAYKRLAQKYHPDMNISNNATQIMQDINEAYNVLRNPVKRTEYDRIINFKKTSVPSEEDVEEIKRRTDEEKKKRNETESVRQRAWQEKESFRRYAEAEHLRREQAEKALRRANSRPKSNIFKIFGILGIIFVGSMTLIVIVIIAIIAMNYPSNFTTLTPVLQPVHQPLLQSVSTSIPIITSPGTKLIQGEAINFIPSISEMPRGFSEDPNSGPLPYANADGYSQIYRNPDFIQSDREVFVGYFTFVFDESESASRVLGEFMNEIENDIDFQNHKQEILDYEKLAKIDQALMYSFESKKTSGNYNIFYITGIQYSNFINVILISAPVDDPNSERVKVIRERIRELSYYYTSLVTNKLSLPDDKQVHLPEPEYQRVPPTQTP